MTTTVTGLKRTKRDEYLRDGQKHINIYFECEIEVDGVKKDCTLHAMNCDGSIRKDAGKFHLCAEINTHEAKQVNEGKEGRDWTLYLPCQKCQKTTAKAAAKVLFPLVEKLEGIEISKWIHKGDGGWFIFDVQSKPVGELERTGRSWRMGPECVGIEYTQTHECPFHGRVQYVEVEPFD